MRLAIIDCGTNTFNLLIVDYISHKKYVKVYNTRIPVKLGQGSLNMSFIAMEPFNRGLLAIGEFNKEIKKHHAYRVLAFATSAIRDASNGKQFVDEVKKQHQIDIEIIDGNREAELIYKGNKEAVPLAQSTSLIMDIGGGSNEFILANNTGMIWKQSFQIGAARMLEKFSPSNPITLNEINNINNYLKLQLEPLFNEIKKHAPNELIGSSGAFDSIVEIINGELNGELLLESKTCYEIDINKYFKISDLIKKSTLEDRKQIKGLLSMRVDMIVISCLMVDFILKSFNITKMRVSTYSLKEGALFDFIENLK